MKDITEKIEVELKNKTKLWQTTLDAIGESIFLIDLDHKIIQCNRATLDILGKSSYSEIIGHSCWELVHGTSGPVEWCPMKCMLESGHREATIRQLNGRWVEISSDPVFNDEGEITGAVHIITDITTRKQAEDALRESEQQYRTILNSLSDPMHVIDKDLRIVFKNPAMTEWLNKLNINSDIVGKTVFEAFPFLIYDKVRNEYDKVFSTGELLFSGEITDVYNRNITTEILKIPVISEGKFSQIITIMRDITEQKESEQKLKESEKNYRQLIEDSLEGVWVIDENANTTLVNPSMARIFGYEVDEMKGRNLFDFTAQEDIEFTKNNLERRKRGVKEEIEKVFIRKDGKKVITRLMTSPIFDDDGSYKGAIALVADITERKTAEKLLKNQKQNIRICL